MGDRAVSTGGADRVRPSLCRDGWLAVPALLGEEFGPDGLSGSGLASLTKRRRARAFRLPGQAARRSVA